MKRILRILILLLGSLILMGVLASCRDELRPRPPGTDGSAQWAYNVALPRARNQLAPDAVPVEIVGEGVMPDGRLAANRGKWTVDFSSFTAAGRVSILVDHLRSVTVGSSTSPGVIHTLGTPPGTFPDSIAIFSTTAGKGATGTRSVAKPVECKFDNIAGTHVWTIRFKVDSTTETHKVRWDGIWLEVR